MSLSHFQRHGDLFVICWGEIVEMKLGSKLCYTNFLYANYEQSLHPLCFSSNKISWMTHFYCVNLDRGQAEREFKVEVEAIGKVKHKNLVGLIGYCIEGARR